MKVFHGADVNQIKAQYNVGEIIDFSSNVNIFQSKKVHEVLQNINAKDLSFYPDIEYTNLRDKLSQRYDIPSKNIIVGNGSTELIFLIMKLNSIKRIGIFNPTFLEYERAAKINNKEVVDLYYTEDFNIDLSELKQKKLDLVVICNPNNPSGTLNDLREVVAECYKNNTMVFVDETFMDFTGAADYSALNLMDQYENIFVLKAVTKFYALTGVRLGYGFSSQEIINQLWNIKEPWTINVFAEKLVEVIFDKPYEEQTVKYYKSEIQWLYGELSKIDEIQVFPTKSNYFLLKIKTSKSSAQLKEDLVLNHGILIRDCSNFKGLDDSYFRVNIRDRRENAMLVEALKKELQ